MGTVQDKHDLDKIQIMESLTKALTPIEALRMQQLEQSALNSVSAEPANH